MTTKFNLDDVVYILYNGKINKVKITSITKTEVTKNNKYETEQETYGLELPNGNRLVRSNNGNDLYTSIEELLNNIEIVE